MSLTLEFPFPPSVNHYWKHRVITPRGANKRSFLQSYISDAGKQYRRAVVEQCLITDSPLRIEGALACTLDLYPPCNRKRDCDNYAKALLDALTHARVYSDDSQIIDLRIRMHPKSPPGRVQVTLESMTQVLSAHNQIELAGV